MLTGIMINGCEHENNREKSSRFRWAIRHSKRCLAWSPKVTIHTTQSWWKRDLDRVKPHWRRGSEKGGGGGGRGGYLYFYFLFGMLPEKSSNALFKEMLPHVGINSWQRVVQQVAVSWPGRNAVIINTAADPTVRGTGCGGGTGCWPLPTPFLLT